MIEIGARIYYDTETGNVLVNSGQMKGFVRKTSVEKEIKKYKSLSERNPNTFDYIQLEYGEYAEDFAIANGYRVNPETKELEFSYPDPNEEGDEEQEKVYQEPLTDQVKRLESKQTETDSTLLDFMETVLLGGM